MVEITQELVDKKANAFLQPYIRSKNKPLLEAAVRFLGLLSICDEPNGIELKPYLKKHANALEDMVRQAQDVGILTNEGKIPPKFQRLLHESMHINEALVHIVMLVEAEYRLDNAERDITKRISNFLKEFEGSLFDTDKAAVYLAVLALTEDARHFHQEMYRDINAVSQKFHDTARASRLVGEDQTVIGPRTANIIRNFMDKNDHLSDAVERTREHLKRAGILTQPVKALDPLDAEIQKALMGGNLKVLRALVPQMKKIGKSFEDDDLVTASLLSFDEDEPAVQWRRKKQIIQVVLEGGAPCEEATLKSIHESKFIKPNETRALLALISEFKHTQNKSTSL